MKLEGKIALDTEANGGIGRAIAARFAREGTDVVVHYSGEQASEEQTAREAKAQGRGLTQNAGGA